MSSSDAYDCFKKLLLCNDINEVCSYALNLVQTLQLGKLEKGTVSSAAKFKSRDQRWFTVNNKKNVFDVDNKTLSDTNIYIQRDSLIKLPCTRGKPQASIEKYRVLAIFTKYYNKWFVSIEDKFLWTNGDSNNNVKNSKVLVQFLKHKVSVMYKVVNLEQEGDWIPTQVYRIKHFKDIMKVERNLLDSSF